VRHAEGNDREVIIVLRLLGEFLAAVLFFNFFRGRKDKEASPVHGDRLQINKPVCSIVLLKSFDSCQRLALGPVVCLP